MGTTSQIVCILGIVWAVSSTAADTEDEKLVPSGLAASTQVGISLALSGGTLVTGAPLNDDEAHNAGSVYVYERSGGAWLEKHTLYASDASADAGFGYDVAIDDDTIVVGAYRDNEAAAEAGAAYVFQRIGGVWIEQVKLLDPAGAKDDWFGTSVAIDGNTIAVGAPFAALTGTDAGSVTIFTGAGATWTVQDTLGGDRSIQGFGTSVALDDERLVVGAPALHTDDTAGGAFVFRRENGDWLLEDELQPTPRLALFSGAGTCVAISGDWVALGAADYDESSGRVYLYHRDGTEWPQDTWIFGGAQAFTSRFGADVALLGNRLLVGATYGPQERIGKGAAYIYTLDNGDWLESAELFASDGFTDDGFGFAVALTGDFVAVTAPYHDTGVAPNVVSNTGAIYSFGEESVAGDVNGDLQVDAADVQLVINGALGLGTPDSDVNSDGVVDALDIQLVINAALGLEKTWEK